MKSRTRPFSTTIDATVLGDGERHCGPAAAGGQERRLVDGNRDGVDPVVDDRHEGGLGVVQDGHALVENGEDEIVVGWGDGHGADDLGTAPVDAGGDRDDRTLAGDADPQRALAVEGAGRQAGREGEGVTGRREAARVELADLTLDAVDDEGGLAVEGDADAEAGCRGHDGADLQGGEVEGADLPSREVAQDEVLVGLADVDLVVLRVLDPGAGVDPGGHAVDAVDLAALGAPHPRAGIEVGHCVVGRADAEDGERGGEQEADDRGEGDDGAATRRLLGFRFEAGLEIRAGLEVRFGLRRIGAVLAAVAHPPTPRVGFLEACERNHA